MHKIKQINDIKRFWSFVNYSNTWEKTEPAYKALKLSYWMIMWNIARLNVSTYLVQIKSCTLRMH